MIKINKTETENSPQEHVTHDLNAYLKIVGISCLGILTLLLLTKTINEAKMYTTIGVTGAESNKTISVHGHGEISAAPDLATFSFDTIVDGKTVEEAQSKAADMSNKAIAYLKAQGVADKDISVQDYNTSEKYDQKPCVIERGVNSLVPTCPPTNQVSGYTTNQSVEVKVRGTQQDSTKLGDLIAAIGKFGVKTSQVYYSFDNPANLKNEARQAAIMDARQQASVLASQLGIVLGKVVGFEDSSQNMPYAYDTMSAGAPAMSAKAIAPVLPSGDKTATSDVVVTYSIN